MRAVLLILAQFLSGGDAQAVTRFSVPAAGTDAAPACCCCAPASACDCGCQDASGPPGPARSDSSSSAVQRCPCGPPPAPRPPPPQVRVDLPRLVLVAPLADLPVAGSDAGGPEAQARAHGPPPALSHLATVVQLR